MDFSFFLLLLLLLLLLSATAAVAVAAGVAVAAHALLSSSFATFFERVINRATNQPTDRAASEQTRKSVTATLGVLRKMKHSESHVASNSC